VFALGHRLLPAAVRQLPLVPAPPLRGAAQFPPVPTPRCRGAAQFPPVPTHCCRGAAQFPPVPTHRCPWAPTLWEGAELSSPQCWTHHCLWSTHMWGGGCAQLPPVLDPSLPMGYPHMGRGCAGLRRGTAKHRAEPQRAVRGIPAPVWSHANVRPEGRGRGVQADLTCPAPSTTHPGLGPYPPRPRRRPGGLVVSFPGKKRVTAPGVQLPPCWLQQEKELGSCPRRQQPLQQHRVFSPD